MLAGKSDCSYPEITVSHYSGNNGFCGYLLIQNMPDGIGFNDALYLAGNLESSMLSPQNSTGKTNTISGAD
jgi:hypothetical protein